MWHTTATLGLGPHPSFLGTTLKDIRGPNTCNTFLRWCVVDVVGEYVTLPETSGSVLVYVDAKAGTDMQVSKSSINTMSIENSPPCIVCPSVARARSSANWQAAINLHLVHHSSSTCIFGLYRATTKSLTAKAVIGTATGICQCCRSSSRSSIYGRRCRTSHSSGDRTGARSDRKAAAC